MWIGFFVFWIHAAMATPWQQPPGEVLDVLHAPPNPGLWISPDATHALEVRRVMYPPLADKASGMRPLAGIRVDTRNNGRHGATNYEQPVIIRIEDGQRTPLDVGDMPVLGSSWSPDGSRFAVFLKHKSSIGLWLGTPDGKGSQVTGVALNLMFGSAVRWLPDNETLVLKTVAADRSEPPVAPLLPPGPETRAGSGGTAISTYEARDLLKTAHDDGLFEYYGTSQLMLVNAKTGTSTPIGAPDMYGEVSASPNGKHLLVKRIQGPWSHRHAWYRFAYTMEVWSLGGALEYTAAQRPLADSVPIHGVPVGRRTMRWRASAPASLVWLEAKDGGDWSAKVPHRDEIWMQAFPFRAKPKRIFQAEHRVTGWWWGQRRGQFIVQQYERARRWRHVWRVNADKRKAQPWFDLSANDRYNNPGSPVTRIHPNGHRLLVEQGDTLFFAGSGSSPKGDRPFLDRRNFATGQVERLFRSEPDKYERFLRFLEPEAGTFLTFRESPTQPRNLFRSQWGEPVAAETGEAVRTRSNEAISEYTDPAPILRQIERRIVTYPRADGVPLSFTLYLPPGYQEGTPLPTVVYAYPREFSDPKMAGQVRGSEQTFTRFGGPSHLFFLLQGYAVLHNTRMPVIGDPDTAYDTFVEQLVAGAQAAVEEAVRLGVTDPNRVGVMGHSHGGLMTVTLLAHSDIFRAGIARSGAYNHTIRPFGFQSERRTLWAARDTYLHLSPVMHAPKINEPLLLIHGAIDENPGTIPFQSERLFEALRGAGGTVRWLSLPFEGHGYRARESVEHVLWEQIQWFDEHVKNAPVSSE